jgi:hypothetical protein
MLFYLRGMFCFLGRMLFQLRIEEKDESGLDEAENG